MAGDHPWVWQQDMGPCHVSGRSRAWLKEHAHDCVDKDTWPPNSPDLNPLDYFFWGVLEARTNSCHHTMKASMIASFKEQETFMDKDTEKGASSKFRTRVDQVIKAETPYTK